MFGMQMAAFLTQIRDICSAPSLSVTNKAKLAKIKTAADELISGFERDAVSSTVKQNGSEPLSEEGPTAGGSTSLSSLCEAKSTNSLSSQDSSAVTPSSSPAAVLPAAHRDVVAIAKLVADDFCASGIPESTKLRKVARDICQLLLVRCMSITTYRLQLATTITADGGSAAGNLSLTGSQPNILLTSFDGPSGSGASIGVDSSLPSAAAAIEAAGVCMKCLAQSAAACQSEDQAVRFAVKTFVDVARQLAKLLYGLQVRLVKQQFSSSTTSPSSDAAREPGSAISQPATPHGSTGPKDLMLPREDYVFEVSEEEATRIAGRKIQQLACAVGHDPTRIIALAAELLHHPIAYLISVAGVSANSGGGSVAQKTKEDAQTLLFQLFDYFGKLSLRQFFLSHSHGGPLGTPFGQQVAHHFVDQIACPVAAEAVVALARHCGDESEGQLLAVRLLTDSVAVLAAEDPFALRSLLRRPFHKKAVLNALLVAAVSVHPTVIAAGLTALEAIAAECLLTAGQELGFLYCNCLLRLLESEYSPIECKLLVISHYLRVISPKPSAVVVGGAVGGLQRPPVLLLLYSVYDANERLHHCNPVQQLVASFARIVRTASPGDFARSGDSKGDPGAATAAALSIAALSALVATVEVLTATGLPPTLPPNLSQSLPPLTHRDAKITAQRQVDVINSNPVKGIMRKFAAEHLLQHDAATEGAASAQALEYQNIPAPDEQAAKIIPAVSRFLLYTPSLNPTSIGEFLSDPKPFPLQVCKHFMSLLDLRSRSVPAALSEMLTVLQLPKEGQRIERLLEFFSHSYFIANVDSATDKAYDSSVFPFRNVDACFVVVVATVMLNTDLHNPRVSSKMNRQGFASQLRGCNDNQNFPEGFADSIFDSISTRPLSNVKAIGAANVESQAHVSTAPPQSGKMDLIFFSNEERKELLYGMERQRIVSETRDLLVRRSPETEVLGPEWADAAHVLALARDLFLAIWPSICVLFGVAMGGSRVADPILTKCVKGLHCSFCLAAAFSLPTEGDVSLMTLLQTSTQHEQAVRAALAVAASEYGENLSVSTWSTILQLLADAKKGHLSGAAAEAESVYSAVEGLVARSSSTWPSGSSGPSVSDAEEGAQARAAVPSGPGRVVIEAMMRNIAQTPRGDGLSLATHLHILRRSLVVTQIEQVAALQSRSRTTPSLSGSMRGGTVVTKRIAIELFVSHVLPHLPAIYHHNNGSEECLQLLTEGITQLLTEMWKAHCPSASASETRLITEALSTFVVCYDSPSTTLSTKIQLMQGVRLLLSTTISNLVSSAGGPSEHAASLLAPFELLQAAWKHLLGVIARALCDAGVVGTEGCSLAVLVLRNVCVLCTASGATAATTPIPEAPRNLLFLLLIRCCYVGSMCADVTNSKTCVHQLVAIGTTALNFAALSSSGPRSPVGPGPEAQLSGSALLAPQESELQSCDRAWSSEQFTAALDNSIILDVLETLCLLLRCEKDVIRADTLEALRQLVMQLHPQHMPHLARHLANVVLEGALGHATTHFHVPVTDPSVSCFPLFGMNGVPQSMKRCSRTAFTTTLPAVLQFVTQELLPACSGETFTSVSETVLLRMMLPVVVSPRSHHTPSRSVAARSMMAVIGLCASHPAGTTTAAVLQAVGLALVATRIQAFPVTVEPLPFSAKPRSSFALDTYVHNCEAALVALAHCEAPEVSRRDGTHTAAQPPAPSSASGQQLPPAAVETANAVLQPLIVSPLPKVIQQLLLRADTTDGCLMGKDSSTIPSDGFWRPPSVAIDTVMLLLRQCASDAVACYRAIVDGSSANPRGQATPQLGAGVSPAKAATLHKELHGQPTTASSVAHASIRGSLDSYFAIAMALAAARDAVVQALTADSMSLFTLFRSVQLQLQQALREQQQQHSSTSLHSAARWPVVHSCLAGMSQEVAIVVQHWVATLASSSSAGGGVLWQRFGRLPSTFRAIADLLDASGGDGAPVSGSTADSPLSSGIARAVYTYMQLFHERELLGDSPANPNQSTLEPSITAGGAAAPGEELIEMEG
jgi:hypothetical protein